MAIPKRSSQTRDDIWKEGDAPALSRPRDAARTSWSSDLLFWALLAAYVVPVCCFPYFRTRDGAAHLATSRMLLDFSGSTLLQSLYVLQLRPDPNWTATALLTGARTLVPPLLAEKLLVSMYIILFPV